MTHTSSCANSTKSMPYSLAGFLPQGGGGTLSSSFPLQKLMFPPTVWSENNRNISITTEICITIDSPKKIPGRKPVSAIYQTTYQAVSSGTERQKKLIHTSSFSSNLDKTNRGAVWHNRGSTFELSLIFRQK